MGWGGISLPGPGNWTPGVSIDPPKPATLPKLPGAAENLVTKASDKWAQITGIDLHAGTNAQNALEHPLSFATGGLAGGDAGVAQFGSGGAGVKNSSLTGGLSNKNNSYGLIALATYFGLSSMGGEDAAAGAAGEAGGTTMAGDLGLGAGEVGTGAGVGSAGGSGAGAAAGGAAGGSGWGSLIGPGISLLNTLVNKGSDGSAAANAADPFASQRPMYQEMLKQLMSNPNMIQDTPEYKARMGSGLETVNRAAGAKGQLTSGNRLTALDTYGQESASVVFKEYADLLTTLSGGNQGSPAAASQALSQADQNEQQRKATQLALLANIGNTIYQNW